MSYQQPNSSNSLLKGCGIALLIVFVLLGALIYGGWRLFKRAADGTWTVRIGDTVKRSFGQGLATSHFTLTGSPSSGKSTNSSVDSYRHGSKSVNSECLSSVIKAQPKHPELWSTPTAAQSQALAAQLEFLGKGLSRNYLGTMRMESKEHLISAFDPQTERLCVAEFSGAWPLN